MPYQLIIVLYLVFTTINTLLTRRYTKSMTMHPRLSELPTKLTIALLL